ncbi:hypothetical protein KDD17_15635 [Sulfitobacter albidus]|uniref:Uncharacterized protein n=1 Tax=Sulfitobacter albidus TaxID=2829501 RepID=A0A975PM09_9RHOB|nr:hypothetical protein [Sulfitobacter albidus]QUJ76308.1 hypothetical protein KDD17_15635 [Sulfitobacter albidus]
MSSVAHLYPDLGSLIPDGAEADIVIEEIQDEKLRAYEEGYQAGWTDAEKNVTEEQARVGAEFVHTLQDLSFTYHEALARLNRGLRPMFEQMVSTLLPRSVGPALQAHLVSELLTLTQTQTEGQVVLKVSDSDLMTIETLLEDAELKMPVSVEAEPGLAPNQLMLSLDTVEREINLDSVTQEIAAALSAFNFHAQTEPSHD